MALANSCLRFKYLARFLRFSTLLCCLPITLFTFLIYSGCLGENMKRLAVWFNIYLLLLLLPGCSTFGKKKELSTIRFYLEVNQDGTGRSGPVPIYRANPLYVNVQKEAFLKEGHIERAHVVDVPGGFEIRLEFARKGRLILEQYSTAYRGKRVAIYCTFTESRFLGAPTLERSITDGTFSFTPDATREEAERIVLGLNNVAEKLAGDGF